MTTSASNTMQLRREIGTKFLLCVSNFGHLLDHMYGRNYSDELSKKYFFLELIYLLNYLKIILEIKDTFRCVSVDSLFFFCPKPSSCFDHVFYDMNIYSMLTKI